MSSAAIEDTGAKTTAMRLRRRPRRTPWGTVLLMVLPFLVMYLVFLIYPTVRVIMLSFTNADIAGRGHFIGVANYVRLWKDSLFWASLWHTIYFILLSVVPNTAVGLIFALMIVRLNRLRGFVMALMFLPYVLPVSVVTQIWTWVLSSAYGIVNFLFHLKVNWFQDPIWAMPSVAFVTIWWTVGFNILMFIAGLQSIPSEYYEAASLDGADRGFRVFRYFTWPLIWPVTSLVLVLQLILQWQIFNQVYLLTNGGPFNSTIVVLMHMYIQAFTRYRGGYAATISMALFILILISSILQLRLLRFQRGE
jgi:multiple sugar transport system permease protein